MDVEEIRGAIERAYEAETGTAAPPAVVDVLTAQVSTETGFGQKMMGFNFGGIKGTSPEGKSAVYETHEVIGGRDVVIHDSFRAYGSADAGALDYVRLLSHRFPEALDAAANGDVEGFAHALKMKGYFTADEGAYARAMRGAMGARPELGRAPHAISGVRSGESSLAEPARSSDFATTHELARVVDAIASSALRSVVGGSDDEDQKGA